MIADVGSEVQCKVAVQHAPILNLIRDTFQMYVSIVSDGTQLTSMMRGRPRQGPASDPSVTEESDRNSSSLETARKRPSISTYSLEETTHCVPSSTVFAIIL